MPSNKVTRSICYKSATSPRAFHKCTTQNRKRCFVDEDVNRVTLTMDYFDGKDLRRLIKKYVDSAKTGDLQELPSDLDNLATPCTTQPDIWEMRIDRNRDLFRLYYSEKEGRDPEFVALAFGKKEIKGSSEEIRDTQNGSIKAAQERYNLYSSLRWGHVDRRCEFCI